MSSAAEVSYSFLMLSMLLIRLAKVALIGSLAAYAFIVAYDNVVEVLNQRLMRGLFDCPITLATRALLVTRPWHH